MTHWVMWLRLVESSACWKRVLVSRWLFSNWAEARAKALRKKGDGCVTLGVGCEATLKTKVTHERAFTPVHWRSPGQLASYNVHLLSNADF